MKEKIKRVIIDTIRRKEDLALIAFMNEELFKEYCFSEGGEWTLTDENGTNLNILLMADVNEECTVAFDELMQEQIIKFDPTSSWVATFDGGIYDLPIAKRQQKYQNLHWLPVLVRKGINFSLLGFEN